MKRWILRLAWLLAGVTGALLLAAGVGLFLFWQAGRGGSPANAGEPTQSSIPAPVLAARATALAESGVAREGDRQILFGDLHVHTQFSADARVFGLPVLGGELAHPPADACDFARFCSGVDFWSINDHAEGLLSEQWRETKKMIRECNAIAGPPDDPDVVAFLGWEWSQTGIGGPESHYGHRNVILLKTAEDAVPTRPIAASRINVWGLIGGLVAAADPDPTHDYAAYHRTLWNGLTAPACAEGVPVRELPEDCAEVVPTPDLLFEKLDDWGFPSLVIPHGLAWGTTNPPGARFDHQLGPMHDPARQRLLEMYSGHGSSEVWRDIRHVEVGADGDWTCPAPRAGFTPCCWQAGELARKACTDPASSACEADVVQARQDSLGGLPLGDIGTRREGASAEDWGTCGQLEDAFLPSFGYRPKQSAQYGLALETHQENGRFRFGLIGASDNHRARPGSSYKEFGLGAMTDGNRPAPAWTEDREDLRARIILRASGMKRGDSFYYSGGLAAVHTARRDRESIFAALQRRETYGTSGPRIQLWFDLISKDGVRHPMGSEVTLSGVPRFEVRAAGAFVQKPGCPDFVEERLGAEEMTRLCVNECHHPGEVRIPIDRIEIVRIRPGVRPGGDFTSAIEDPWRVIPCSGDPEGCRVVFDDPELTENGQEFVYYVRALQMPTPTINGDPLACERDAGGHCVRAHICRSNGFDQPVPADCIAPTQERAWSSPLFVLREGS
ncbi:MAG: DUF3604 domain-containing protein [Deltaproteobacteria bacterium]|nr:DUF3604 domain-containing protein [Deltaproteobacteria bacterium]